MVAKKLVKSTVNKRKVNNNQESKKKLRKEEVEVNNPDEIETNDVLPTQASPVESNNITTPVDLAENDIIEEIESVGVASVALSSNSYAPRSTLSAMYPHTPKRNLLSAAKDLNAVTKEDDDDVYGYCDPMKMYQIASQALSKLNIKTSEDFNKHLSVIQHYFMMAKLYHCITGEKPQTETQRQLAWTLLMGMFDPDSRDYHIRELLNIRTPKPDPAYAWTLLKQGFQNISLAKTMNAMRVLESLTYTKDSDPGKIIDKMLELNSILMETNQELKEDHMCVLLDKIFNDPKNPSPYASAIQAAAYVCPNNFTKLAEQIKNDHYRRTLLESLNESNKSKKNNNNDSLSLQASNTTESTMAAKGRGGKKNPNMKPNNNHRSGKYSRRGGNNTSNFNTSNWNNRRFNNSKKYNNQQTRDRSGYPRDNNNSNYANNNSNNNNYSPRNNGNYRRDFRDSRGGPSNYHNGGRSYQHEQSNRGAGRGYGRPQYNNHSNESANYGNDANVNEFKPTTSSIDDRIEKSNVTRNLYNVYPDVSLSTIKYSNNSPMDLLDSGSTSTHTPYLNRLTNITQTPEKYICIADGSIVKSSGITGTVGCIPNVNYNPNFTHTLVSVGSLAKLGYRVSCDDEKAIIYDKLTDNILGNAEFRDGLYYLNIEDIQPSQRMLVDKVMMSNNSSNDSYTRWHSRLHIPKSSMEKIIEAKVVDDFDIINKDLNNQHNLCTCCLKGKMDRQRQTLGYPLGRPNDRVGSLILSDVKSLPIAGYNGQKYIVGFIDVYSDYKYLYYLKTKDEVSEAFELYIAHMESLGHKISALHSDNGGEYVGDTLDNHFRKVCRKHRIAFTTTPPHTPQANRRMERYWRTLMDGVRTRLIDSKLPKKLWPYAAEYTTYIWNRTKIISKEHGKYTPYELITGNKASIGNLRRWGCLTSVHVNKQFRNTLSDKAKIGYFIGFESKSRSAYIYIPNKGVESSGHCLFDELKVYGDDYNVNSVENSLENDEEFDLSDNVPSLEVTNIVHQPISNIFDKHRETQPNIIPSVDLAFATLNILEHPRITQKSSDNIEVIVRDCELLIELVMKVVNMDPKQALLDENWRKSMAEEIDALIRNDTWDIEEIPLDKQALKYKWVFAEKYDVNNILTKLKSRLTVKGYDQKPGIDYNLIFAPVVRLVTIRLLLALAALYNLTLYQMDADTAFLNSVFGPNDPAIYLEPMEGYDFVSACRQRGLDPNNKRLKLRLKRALYGLKQSPRAWYETLHQFIVSQGFKALLTDVCLYTKQTEDGRKIIMAIYVDDMIIAVNDQSFWLEFKKTLMERFKMKDLGKLNWVLGMRVTTNEEEIRLDQQKYIESILDKFLHKDSKPRDVPISVSNSKYLSQVMKSLDTNDQSKSNLKGLRPLNNEEHTRYRQIVGSLMYAMLGTRPDIAYSLSVLSRYMHAPLQIHYDLAIYVLRYLKGSKERYISYKRNSDNRHIVGFTDSDWAGCTETRRSTTGYVFFLAGGAISWKSARQTRTTLSSQQAEYYALSEGCREAKWFRQLLIELGYFTNDKPHITIYMDSTTAKSLALNPISGGRSKHFEIQYHWLRELVVNNEVSIEYINTDTNISDIMTKALYYPKLVFLIGALFAFSKRIGALFAFSMIWLNTSYNTHRYNKPLETIYDDEDEYH